MQFDDEIQINIIEREELSKLLKEREKELSIVTDNNRIILLEKNEILNQFQNYMTESEKNLNELEKEKKKIIAINSSLQADNLNLNNSQIEMEKLFKENEKVLNEKIHFLENEEKAEKNFLKSEIQRLNDCFEVKFIKFCIKKNLFVFGFIKY